MHYASCKNWKYHNCGFSTFFLLYESRRKMDVKFEFSDLEISVSGLPLPSGFSKDRNSFLNSTSRSCEKLRQGEMLVPEPTPTIVRFLPIWTLSYGWGAGCDLSLVPIRELIGGSQKRKEQKRRCVLSGHLSYNRQITIGSRSLIRSIALSSV